MTFTTYNKNLNGITIVIMIMVHDDDTVIWLLTSGGVMQIQGCVSSAEVAIRSVNFIYISMTFPVPKPTVSMRLSPNPHNGCDDHSKQHTVSKVTRRGNDNRLVSETCVTCKIR